jgi:hypothetical protein
MRIFFLQRSSSLWNEMMELLFYRVVFWGGFILEVDEMFHKICPDFQKIKKWFFVNDKLEDKKFIIHSIIM